MGGSHKCFVAQSERADRPSAVGPYTLTGGLSSTLTPETNKRFHEINIDKIPRNAEGQLMVAPTGFRR